MGTALALGGIAFGVIPPGLEAVGYPLGPTGGYILLGLAALCGIGAMGAFWPLLSAAWLWLRREAELQRLNTERREALEARDRWRKHFEEKQSEAQRLDAVRERQLEKIREAERECEELKQENEELIAESGNRPDPLPDTLEEWLKTTPLTTVPNQTYRNDRIELDGFHYDRCVFEDCTFSFKGNKPFRVAESCRVKGMIGIDARGPQVQAMLIFMKQLGAVHPNSEWYDLHDGSKLPEDAPEEAQKAVVARESRPEDEELRRRCCDLSEKLFEYFNERARQHPQVTMGPLGINPSVTDPEARKRSGQEYFQETVRHNQETKSQYDEQFGREVARLLDALERREWSSPEERKKLEGFWVSPDERVQRIAQHLDNICHNV